VADEFKNEVFSGSEPNPVRTCSLCGDKPALVRTMLDPRKRRSVRMFKYEYGKQTWREE
jgi:hypothetical protein